MSDNYVEVLVKRNVEKEKKKKKIFFVIIMLSSSIFGIITMSSVFVFTFAISVLGYGFIVSRYHIEFEYYYFDGELTISKIINKSRRKKILELNDGIIKMIAPVNSAEMNTYNNLGKKDCTANDASTIPYAVVYMDKELRRVDIQMNDELYREFRRNIPYKIKDY